MLQGVWRDRLVNVLVRLYDRTDYPRAKAAASGLAQADDPLQLERAAGAADPTRARRVRFRDGARAASAAAALFQAEGCACACAEVVRGLGAGLNPRRAVGAKPSSA